MTTKIVIYKTGEDNSNLLETRMMQIIAEQNKSDKIEILGIHSDAIRNDILLQPDISGLILPGRCRGQDYRDELEAQGLSAIQQAAHNGLSIMAICAGSYVLSNQVKWHNSFQLHAGKNAFNTTPVFQGTTIGAMEDLWRDGYRASLHETHALSSNTLAAKVVGITYSPLLKPLDLELDQETNGHSLYWGGGAFFPEDPDTLTTLAHHQTEVMLQGETYSHLPAIIEFKCGRGTILFSNIHPEIDAKTFENVFRFTPRARMMPDDFREDKNRLCESNRLQNAVFSRFLDNCSLYQRFDRTGKKPVAVTSPSH